MDAPEVQRLLQAVNADRPLRPLLASESLPALRSAAFIAVYRGSVEATKELLKHTGGRTWLSSQEGCPQALIYRPWGLAPTGSERSLLRQPPIVIAACQLHTRIVSLLLEHGVTLPAEVDPHRTPSDPTHDGETVPFLAFWVSHVSRGGNHRAALPMLRLLLAAGADPLAAGAAQPASLEALGGRVGCLCSFALTCASPPLLAAAVRHVLAQCAAVRGGRQLSAEQVATLLVAARLAGLGDESEQLLAHAAHLGSCFPRACRHAAPARQRAQQRTGAHAQPGGASGSSSPRVSQVHSRLALQQSRDKRRKLLTGGEAAGIAHAGTSSILDEGIGDLYFGWRSESSDGGTEGGSDYVSDDGGDGHAAAGAALVVHLRCQLAEAQRQMAAAYEAHARAGDALDGAALGAVQDAWVCMHERQHQLQAAEERERRRKGKREGEGPAVQARHGAAAGFNRAGASAPAAAPSRQPSPAAAAAASNASPSTSAAASDAGPSTSAAARCDPSSSRQNAAPAAAVAPAGAAAARRAASLRLREQRRPSYTLGDMTMVHSGGRVVGGGGAAARRVPMPASEWQHRLQAQLVGDAAAHGLHDVLELLLSQGASADEGVPVSAPGAPTPPAQDTDGAAANERTPLALAAAAGHARCVAVLLRHGAAVDLATLRHAVWSLSVPGVQALLAAGRGRLPPTQPCTLAEGPLNCPVVLLLVRHLELAAAAAARPRPAASLAALASQAVRIMDLLLDAGYRIKVYRDMCVKGGDGVWRMGRVQGLQAVELERLDVAGLNRLLWAACCRQPWSLEAHASFHPAFKAAARTLLLVARHGESKQAEAAQRRGAAGLGPAAAFKAAVRTLLLVARHGEKKPVEAAQRRDAAGPGPAASKGDAGAAQQSCPTASAMEGGGLPLQQQPPRVQQERCDRRVAAAVLGRLPVELLQKIIEDAAYPLSPWVALDQGAR